MPVPLKYSSFFADLGNIKLIKETTLGTSFSNKNKHALDPASNVYATYKENIFLFCKN